MLRTFTFVFLIIGGGLIAKNVQGKAEINQTCYVNKKGLGTCDFRNKGQGEGHKTLRIHVLNSQTQQRSPSVSLYSGLIRAQDLRTRQFRVPDVEALCNLPLLEGESLPPACQIIVEQVDD